MIIDSVEVPESEVKPYQFGRDDGIIGMMDCGGSNLVKIDEQFREATGSGIVRIIATSRINHPECKAREKAEKVLNVPFVEEDFARYEGEMGVQSGDYFKALNPDLHSRIRSGLSPQRIIQIRADVCKRLMDKIYE